MYRACTGLHQVFCVPKVASLVCEQLGSLPSVCFVQFQSVLPYV